MTHATTTPLRRTEFDGLVDERITALLDAAPTTASGDPTAQIEAKDALDEAQLLEASARDFADAVDRAWSSGCAGAAVRYDDAVVITGSQGVIITTTDDYDRERVYHEARAGEVDSVTIGWSLLAYLRTGETA